MEKVIKSIKDEFESISNLEKVLHIAMFSIFLSAIGLGVVGINHALNGKFSMDPSVISQQVSSPSNPRLQ